MPVSESPGKGKNDLLVKDIPLAFRKADRCRLGADESLVDRPACTTAANVSDMEPKLVAQVPGVSSSLPGGALDKHVPFTSPAWSDCVIAPHAEVVHR